MRPEFLPPNQSAIDACHGRKNPEEAARGVESTKVDGRPRCLDCGIARFPRNFYKDHCYCGFKWQPLPASRSE